ncbi:MAG: J domain-containing protein [Litorimonas sp.]
MAKNPYTLLGVAKTATEKEIKSAYRKLAKKLHPDVNPGNAAAEAKFKEVTAAYNLLSNADLRRQYDTGQVDASGQQQNPFAGGFRHANAQGGMDTGFGGFGGMGQDDMADMFSSLFGMNMGGGQRRSHGGMGGGFQRRQSPPQKGADVRYKLKMSLIDALTGGVKDLGKGLNVRFPKGIKDGQTLRLREKGRPGVNGGPAGDAHVKVLVQPHKRLKRVGNDLQLTVPISLSEAMKGVKIDLDVPSGKVSLTMPAGTNSGKKFRLKEKGVRAKDGTGDLYVTAQIVLTDGELAGASVIAAQLPDGENHELRKKLI